MGRHAYQWLADTFELDESTQSGRNLPMEGLRGLAVTLVFFVHYHALFREWIWSGSTSYAVSAFLATIGHSGVDLFFVLSGYLIYGAVIRKHRPYFGFIGRRIERIYPTFLTVLVIYLALSVAFPERSKIPPGTMPATKYVIENALLLPGIFPIDPIVVVTWTLSYEFFFYLTIPLLAATLSMRRWRAGARVVFFFLLAVAYLLLARNTPFNRPGLVMFAGGILLYEVRHSFGAVLPRTPAADLSMWAMLLLTFAAIYVCGEVPVLPSPLPWGPSGPFYRVMILFVTLPIFTLACFNSADSLMTVFTWPPIRWLGNMSYSYYLIHGLTLHGVRLVLHAILPPAGHRPVFFWLMMAVAFGCTLVVSAALFLTVEKRFSLSQRGHRQRVPPLAVA